MRVLAIPADEGGCGFYRVREPCRVLKEDGVHIDIDSDGSLTSVHRNAEGRITSIDPLDYDVVVIQMPSKQDAVDAIPMLKAQGITVVAEFDDDYWAFERGHSMVHQEDEKAMMKCCGLADLVTVSTPALGRKIANESGTPVRVLRNCIPKSYLTVDGQERPDDKLRLGWSGQPFTHPRDLEVVGDTVRNAVRKYDAQFITIGHELAATILGFEDKETLVQGWTPLWLYPAALRLMDVGIVPLRRNEFNESKSYLKGLEYASLGIPFVASDSSEYKVLAGEGVGIIATSKQGWYRGLNTLLSNEDRRNTMAAQGREFARTQTYEANAWKWAEAWERAMNV